MQANLVEQFQKLVEELADQVSDDRENLKWWEDRFNELEQRYYNLLDDYEELERKYGELLSA